MLSAVILVGGKATRIGRDKGLIVLANKPMILHVVEKISSLTDEILLVASSVDQAKRYEALGLQTIVERLPIGSPLSGALTGFQNVKGEYCILTGSDRPLIEPEVMRLLETEAMGHDAATYIWPNGYIEPLLAVYKTKISSKITENLLIRGERKLGFILRNLPDVVYVPINRLTELDPDHYSVIDINTPEELKKSELILKKRVTQSS